MVTINTEDVEKIAVCTCLPCYDKCFGKIYFSSVILVPYLALISFYMLETENKYIELCKFTLY